jgi:hypothetical protein
VRPGPQYGRPDALDGDFGAADGYAGANGYPDQGHSDAGGYPGYERTGGYPASERDGGDGYSVSGRDGGDGYPVSGRDGGDAGGPWDADYRRDRWDSGGLPGGAGDSGDHGYRPISQDDGWGSGAGRSTEQDRAGYQGGDRQRGARQNGRDGHDPAAGPDSGEYQARRHRPSANDTNVGTLADFASYGGYR